MSVNKKIVEPYFLLTDLAQRELIACQHDLAQFQQITTTTYEGIAQNLPAIMSKIEDSNEGARILVKYFIAGEASDGESNTSEDESSSVVSSAVREAKRNMVTVSKRIHKMFKIDQTIFGQIQEQVDQIETLRISIREITKISDDIELLSYNSVFVASKAGLSGAAFTYIAKEIKTLSKETKDYARKMRESSDNLVTNYNRFSSEIESVNEKTNARLSNIDTELDDIFNKYNSGLTNIADLILQLLDRSDGAKNHVPRIMVSLQPQDLVRQLLDQLEIVNKALSSVNSKELTTHLSSADDSALIAIIEEKTAKILAGNNLNKTILDRAARTMDSSVDELSKLLVELKTELKDIETDRISMIDFFSSPQESLGAKSSIEQIFDESVSVIQDIYDFIKTSILKKREVLRFGELLKQELLNIETLFDGMQHIVRQFAMIKVISGIEIAKESILSENMTASSEMFEKLTENIDEHILILRSHLEKINADIISNLDLLNENIENQEKSLFEISDMVNLSINKLKTIRFNINDAVKTVGKESTDLFKLLDGSIKGVENIREIVSTSDTVGSHFDLVIQKANMFYQLGQQNNPTIFDKETNYIRFQEFLEIANKFIDESDNKENQITFVDVSNELSGDLVLF